MGMESVGHKCEGFIEIDKFAVKSYRAIYDTEGEFYADDIRNVIPEQLPKDIDCFCGGFPCQAFSIAGARRGLEDTRGTLIYEMLRLAAVKKPRILFLENVGGLLNHDRGKTLTTIFRAISELGYVCEWQCINSKAYVPQSRYRIYIVGHLGEKPRQTIFPIERADGALNLEMIGRLDIDGMFDMERRIYSSIGAAPTLDTKSKCRVKIYYKNWSNKEPKISTNGTFTLTTKVADQQFAIVDGIIRRLTPLECWRLQGFPDWAYERAAEVNSASQLYKQAGNSVTVPVIQAIAERVKAIE